MPKVIVAMSGGIDSSVTAHLLKEEGYEVEGISFLMWDKPEGTTPSCCSLTAIEETSRIARRIGIHHTVIDIRGDFAEKVITPFIRSYISGLTPNPCILCNRHIKFPHILQVARERGAEYIATGHYARVERRDSRIRGVKDSRIASDISLQPPALLKKGVDTKKDQSYVLYVLTQDTLKRLILPLGNFKKEAVREIAATLGLFPPKCPESQEICFIQERNYVTFIQKLFPAAMEPGPIVDVHGEIIGTHKGIYGYTIGQRKGLGIGSPEPLYVADIDIQANIIYVGPQDFAKKREFFVHELNWIIFPPSQTLPGGKDESGNSEVSFRAKVKVRSAMKEEPATIILDSGYKLYNAGKKQNKHVSGIVHPASFEIIRVVCDRPLWAPATGQSAVFYDKDVVIGGGIISNVEKSEVFSQR